MTDTSTTGATAAPTIDYPQPPPSAGAIISTPQSEAGDILLQPTVHDALALVKALTAATIEGRAAAGSLDIVKQLEGFRFGLFNDVTDKLEVAERERDAAVSEVAKMQQRIDELRELLVDCQSELAQVTAERDAAKLSAGLADETLTEMRAQVRRTLDAFLSADSDSPYGLPYTVCQRLFRLVGGAR